MSDLYLKIASPLKSWLVYNSDYQPVYLQDVPPNPFKTAVNYYFANHLYFGVFDHINETVFDEEYSMLISSKRIAIIRHDIPLSSVSDGYSATLIVTKNSAIEFLSCYTETFISFQFYITPFQPELWLVIGIGLILLCTMLSIYLHYAKLYVFPVWLLLLATMFEEGFPIVASVERKPFFRLILGAWCLMTVILTNCYTGIMTSELNAPLQGRHPITFNDLVCSKIKRSNQNLDHVLSIGGNLSDLYISLHKAYHNKIFHFLIKEQTNISMFDPIESSNCFQLLSKLVPESISPQLIPQFLDLLYNIHFYLLDPSAAFRKTLSEHFVSPVFALMFNLFNPVHPHIPTSVNYSEGTYTMGNIQSQVEKEISSCRRAVFAGTSESVHSELSFVRKNYHWIHFYKGKPIYALPFGLVFSYEGISRVPTYFKFMLESGIYGRLEMEQWSNEYVGRKAIVQRNSYQDGEMPVRITGSLLTAFILFGCSVTTAATYLAVECRLMLLIYFKSWANFKYFKIKRTVYYKR